MEEWVEELLDHEVQDAYCKRVSLVSNREATVMKYQQ